MQEMKPNYVIKGGVENQPLNAVEWVSRDELHPNDYNPNRVAPPELELLKISILENGWTQPIVALPDGQIVDGFHRWTVSADPVIAELTGGLVPVVRVHTHNGNEMMATIRHNRARGSHDVRIMSNIVRHLIDVEKFDYDGVMRLLGMEWEEVDRLYDLSGMTKRAAADGFSKGWRPG